MTIHDAHILSIGFARRVEFAALDERRELEILGPHAPTPASVRVFEVVTTDERDVAAGLVRCEMSNQPAVTERDGIAVEHEHAAPVPRDGKQLAGTALLVEVASERTAPRDRLAAA